MLIEAISRIFVDHYTSERLQAERVYPLNA